MHRYCEMLRKVYVHRFCTWGVSDERREVRRIEDEKFSRFYILYSFKHFRIGPLFSQKIEKEKIGPSSSSSSRWSQYKKAEVHSISTITNFL